MDITRLSDLNGADVCLERWNNGSDINTDMETGIFNIDTYNDIPIYSIKGNVGASDAFDWSCVGSDRYAPPTA